MPSTRIDAPPSRYKLEQEELQLQEEVISRICIVFTGPRLGALIVSCFCSCARPRPNSRTRRTSCNKSKRSRWCFERSSIVAVLTLVQARLATDEERFWQEQLVTLLQAANARDEEQCLLQQVNASIVSSTITIITTITTTTTIAVIIVCRPRRRTLTSRFCDAATC